jgi:hypothetical protein
VLSSPLDEERRSDLVLRGQLLVFKQVPPLLEVARLSEELLPPSPDEGEIEGLQGRFRGDARMERLLRSALEQVGVVPARTYWDRIHLRIVPPAADRQVGTIEIHRDTWSSNVPQQTNWWLTLRPLTEERTIAFYPGYWDRPIANTSASWDLDAIRERRQAGEPIDDLPIVPAPTEPVATRLRAADGDRARRSPLLLRRPPPRKRPQRIARDALQCGAADRQPRRLRARARGSRSGRRRTRDPAPLVSIDGGRGAPDQR